MGTPGVVGEKLSSTSSIGSNTFNGKHSVQSMLLHVLQADICKGQQGTLFIQLFELDVVPIIHSGFAALDLRSRIKAVNAERGSDVDQGCL